STCPTHTAFSSAKAVRNRPHTHRRKTASRRPCMVYHSGGSVFRQDRQRTSMLKWQWAACMCVHGRTQRAAHCSSSLVPGFGIDHFRCQRQLLVNQRLTVDDRLADEDPGRLTQGRWG